MEKTTGFGTYVREELAKRDRKIRQLRFLVIVIMIYLIVQLFWGRASMSTDLSNPATGQEYTCKASGWGWFGTPAAIIMHHRCVADMESRGYSRAK